MSPGKCWKKNDEMVILIIYSLDTFHSIILHTARMYPTHTQLCTTQNSEVVLGLEKQKSLKRDVLS